MAEAVAERSTGRATGVSTWVALDWPMITTVAAIVLIGLIMVASASIAIAEREVGEALYLFQRQLAYAFLGTALAAAIVAFVPSAVLQACGPGLLGVGLLLLVLVLIPGVGREVNGSVRWLPLLLFNLQVSEVAKLCVFIYLAGYAVRRRAALLTTWRGFTLPVGVLCLVAALLLAEPNFGAAAVIGVTGTVMLFLAGAPLLRMGGLAVIGLTGAGALVVSSPYRWERLTAFLNPWADPFDSGFQLTQALIAVGRGGWFGVGLGNSVQKLFYLPEAHTDFLFSVLAEELGVAGVLVVVALFGFLVWRVFRVGTASLAAGRSFGAYLCWGIGFWLGLQAFINMGVNLGLLPTKGLTLPLMSYGGSSLVMSLVAIALVLRVDHELRHAAAARSGDRGAEVAG